jgi:hypothetical protein
MDYDNDGILRSIEVTIAVELTYGHIDLTAIDMSKYFDMRIDSPADTEDVTHILDTHNDIFGIAFDAPANCEPRYYRLSEQIFVRADDKHLHGLYVCGIADRLIGNGSRPSRQSIHF